MKENIKAIVLFPLLLGLALALLHRALDGWRYAAALEWVLFLGLMAGIWIPMILLPYVRRTRNDGPLHRG